MQSFGSVEHHTPDSVDEAVEVALVSQNLLREIRPGDSMEQSQSVTLDPRKVVTGADDTQPGNYYVSESIDIVVLTGDDATELPVEARSVATGPSPYSIYAHSELERDVQRRIKDLDNPVSISIGRDILYLFSEDDLDVIQADAAAYARLDDQGIYLTP
jgi:hypothetical protein